jgi:hypothetical protein
MLHSKEEFAPSRFLRILKFRVEKAAYHTLPQLVVQYPRKIHLLEKLGYSVLMTLTTTGLLIVVKVKGNSKRDPKNTLRNTEVLFMFYFFVTGYFVTKSFKASEKVPTGGFTGAELVDGFLDSCVLEGV